MVWRMDESVVQQRKSAGLVFCGDLVCTGICAFSRRNHSPQSAFVLRHVQRTSRQAYRRSARCRAFLRFCQETHRVRAAPGCQVGSSTKLPSFLAVLEMTTYTRSLENLIEPNSIVCKSRLPSSQTSHAPIAGCPQSDRRPPQSSRQISPRESSQTLPVSQAVSPH